jgi:hypothetical protein
MSTIKDHFFRVADSTSMTGSDCKALLSCMLHKGRLLELLHLLHLVVRDVHDLVLLATDRDNLRLLLLLLRHAVQAASLRHHAHALLLLHAGLLHLSELLLLHLGVGRLGLQPKLNSEYEIGNTTEGDKIGMKEMNIILIGNTKQIQAKRTSTDIRCIVIDMSTQICLDLHGCCKCRDPCRDL